MTRCSVCRLEDSKRTAVDAALRGNIPLKEISMGCGISASALCRHGKHLTAPQAAAATNAAVLPPVRNTAPLVPSEPSIPASKNQLLERIEMLWNESVDGLRVAKENITIKRPNGDSMEVPGDLGARVGFIREGRQILELQGMATGDLVKGEVSRLNVVIVLPAAPGPAQPADWDGVTIDIKGAPK